MKKFLKKLGVFGLICAVLSPFASIPKVNAEEEDCEHYLNQYLFLDITNGNSWEHYTAKGGSRTYTTFLYTFAELAEGQTIRIDKVSNLNLIDENYSRLMSFKSSWFNAATSSNRTLLDESIKERLGNAEEYKYTDKSKYKSITTILHGYWGFEDEEYIKADYNENDLKKINDDNWFKEHTIQGVIIDKGIKGEIDIDVDYSGATLIDDEFSAAYNSDSAGDDSAMDDYFQVVVDDISSGASESSDSIERGYVWENDNDYYINIGIKRTISKKASQNGLNNLHFGYKNPTYDSTYVYNESDSVTEKNKQYYGFIYSTTSSKIDSSYDALMNHAKDPENEGEGNWVTIGYTDQNEFERDMHINVAEVYQWPAVLNVEFSVCSNEVDDGGKDDGGNTEKPTTPTIQKWTLKYKEGKDVAAKDVTNMPGSEEAEIKTAITVTDKKPKRDGYAFQNWKQCDGNDSTVYKSGDTITSEKAITIELCAQWGKEGSENNPKQGVISYVIGFAAVGVVAGAIYLISKKKNLFKQI